VSDTVIRVENLGKKYILSHKKQEAYKTLRDAIAFGTKSLSRKLVAPFGEKNASPAHESDGGEEEFWALKDVSFEIKQGECVGIIGRNGAGKSTLLKILSRITEPTNGRISIKGRVASLLEVGTGFHPELTGRENIYLNGAILGMSKVEIKRKFDEIVAFAEVEKFLDTPVKRYSSGMYVRLAFAVAAHLEPEILIVDEVLAVGDAAFQKKCLGKMGDVSVKQGRTVLFVSHNMQAVSQLTKRCIMLSRGENQFDGSTEQAIITYLVADKEDTEQPAYYEAPPNKTGNYVLWARVHTSDQQGIHGWGNPITFEFALNITNPQKSICFSFQVLNAQQQPITYHWIFDSETPFGRSAGKVILRCSIPKFRMYRGNYTVTTWLSERRSGVLTELLSNICSFEVTMTGVKREEYDWQPNACSYIEDSEWEVD